MRNNPSSHRFPFSWSQPRRRTSPYLSRLSKKQSTPAGWTSGYKGQDNSGPARSDRLFWYESVHATEYKPSLPPPRPGAGKSADKKGRRQRPFPRTLSGKYGLPLPPLPLPLNAFSAFHRIPYYRLS